MEVRQQISRIVDRLPDADARVTLRLVEYLSFRRDPYLSQLQAAGDEDDELSEEGHRLADEGFRALDAGDTVSLEEVRGEFGL